MCYGSLYPNGIGARINALKSGDEIIILKGEGTPPVAVETVTIVWKVDGFSALTAGGTALNCQNMSDVILTGRRFETYQVTAEALHLWGEIIASQKEARDGDTKPDWSIPPAFGSEPE